MIYYFAVALNDLPNLNKVSAMSNMYISHTHIHTHNKEFGKWSHISTFYSFYAQNVTTAADKTAQLSNISHQGNISMSSR